MTATTDGHIHPHADERVRCEMIETGGETRLVISGDLDLDTVGAISDALARLDQIPGACGVSLDHVTFADSWGLEPIVEAIRRRAGRRAEPLRIQCSAPAVQRIFHCLGVRWQPSLDLAAWDAAADRLPTERTRESTRPATA